jgi:hypothetical protein
MPVILAAATSGSTTLQATDAVTATITLPSATTTLAGTTTPSFTTTIGVGGATPSASGAGITFPATQSASTDANTLDDYEEGTWTPTIVGLTTAGTATYSTQSGTYTKIGNLVTLVFSVSWAGHTGTGNLSVQGLPFAVGNVTGNYGGGMGYANALTITGQLFLETVISTSRLDAYAVNNGSASTVAMDASALFEFTLSYRA